MSALEHELLHHPLRSLLAVVQEVDAVGGRRHSFGQHPLADQDVDHARLAGVELAGHHQQEKALERPLRLRHVATVVLAGVAAQAVEHPRGALQQRPLADAQLGLAAREHPPALDQPADHVREVPRDVPAQTVAS